MRNVIIMGAGGRDFHDFARAHRDRADVRVVAFTATQIPGIDDRVYPASLAGPRYPDGIPIRPEEELAELVRTHEVDDVVLSYSDLSHAEVMHKASLVLSTGASFRMLGPAAVQLYAEVPVVAVCAVRTGCGKSQTSRHIGRILTEAGLRVALVRHPMPYGALERMRVQRFASLEDIDAADPTVEEREEYEPPVRQGLVVYAGVDYEAILRRAEQEADVILWDGGNNDISFFAPDLLVTVTDALRPGHELGHHPGEVNLRTADVVLVNKLDSAAPGAAEEIVANTRSVNPSATIVRAESPVTLEGGPDLSGGRVLVVEDGPSITHGGMPTGAGAVAARRAEATLIDPRPHAVGSLVDTFARHPDIGPVLPAMGYGADQLRDLAETIRATPCDAVIIGTPVDLARLIDAGHPTHRATYELREVSEPGLRELLEPVVAAARTAR